MNAVADVVRVHPGPLSGRVRVPGDKSLSHRALIIGAHADGPVALDGLAPSGDVGATAEALRLMGARIELDAASDGALLGSVAGPLVEPSDVVDCGNSGTTLRLLAGVAARIDGTSVFTGDTSLRRRPVDRVRDPLVRMGAVIHARDGDRRPPLVVRGGRLRAIDYTSPVASAQVKSCVLLAGLGADGVTTLRAPARSRDHTERMFAHLGLPVVTEHTDDGETVVLTPGPLRAAPISVPRDPSSAAFWIVAAVAGAGEISVTDVCVNPTRTGFVRVLEQMGAVLELGDQREVAGEPVAELTARPGELQGAVVAGEEVVDTIDELVVLALAGMCSKDGLEVRDAGELRVKESDRIRTLSEVLGALGVTVEEFDDGFRVPGGQRPSGGVVGTDGDHRIAMTAAIAGTLASSPVTIEGFSTVASSYPGFLDDLERLGGHVELLA